MVRYVSAVLPWCFLLTLIGRTWYTISHPPEHYLKDLRTKIERDIWEIQRTVLTFTATELKRYIEQEKSDKEKEALIEVQNQLGTNQTTLVEKALKNYRDILIYTHSESTGNRALDAQKILQNTRWDLWKERKESTILVLHGDSFFLENPNFFWPSLVAFYAKDTLCNQTSDIPKLRGSQDRGQIPSSPKGYLDSIQPREPQERRPIVLSYFPYTNDSSLDGKEAHALVSSLIVQLLTARPHLITDVNRRAKLAEIINSRKWREEEPRIPCEFLAELLCATAETEIYIILDRIDTCTCEITQLVGRLVKMLDDVHNKVVKVFAIMGPLQTLSKVCTGELKRDVQVYLDLLKDVED